ncbi:unnamed protein product [Closterium sp. NIES-65]|nr:unnamed protein product [Closterium sp. NIES-65]
MAKPLTLFAYPTPLSTGCGVQSGFSVNFTFSLQSQDSSVGSNGFAFVITAKGKVVGKTNGVGYGGMVKQSVAIEFDTLQNAGYVATNEPHVRLNIDGLSTSLVAVESLYSLTNGASYTAWVDYDPWNRGSIKVFLADAKEKPEEPLLQREMSLSLGLVVSTDTFVPPGASPFSRYVSTDYRWTDGNKDSWKSSDFHTWDSLAFLGWPVKNQMNCSACWASAVVASVEAAYGIVLNQAAPQLSVEPLFAAMGLTDADKCTVGGSPTSAFEKLVTLDASSGLMGGSDPDPACYTANLNHVVLVIGYFINQDDGSQNRIAPPFWIIRNSWGIDWGDRGHMRIGIEGGDGVCGINVLPGIYPTVKSKSRTPF